MLVCMRENWSVSSPRRHRFAAARSSACVSPPTALVADAPHHPTVGTHARRAPRTTHRAPRTAHDAHRRVSHRAPRCTAHRAPRATLRHAPPRQSNSASARVAWGRCSLKITGRSPMFSCYLPGGKGKSAVSRERAEEGDEEDEREKTTTTTTTTTTKTKKKKKKKKKRRTKR